MKVYQYTMPTPPHPPVLEGCFKDNAARKLPVLAYVGDVTNEECATICQSRGYTYAGTQDGDQCRCGNDLSTSVRTATSLCDERCAGDATQSCGGPWRNQVYSLAPLPPKDVFRHVGCVADHANNRRMRLAYIDKKGNTVEECIKTCQHNGHVIAGLQYGWQCWCSDSLVGAEPADSSRCNKPCTGNPSEICGGGFHNSVWAAFAPEE
eukprot:TRINITY_DN1438_c0_g1_i1.p1 TRINITY_DN1438_c0_g1~~TRINITY_DN1438_c0_g1_i1.p1  ORF type:complete len:208 (+),score=38.61 TRINITY_DN1438_c0_g1_i1:824-1447(+)